MKKLVYIASCAHSGSTLLDTLMGTHPNVCGLGEVAMLVKPGKRRNYVADGVTYYCGCGAALLRCPFWSDLIEAFDRQPERPIMAHYADVLRRTTDRGSRVACDSSKYPKFLRKVLDGATNGILRDAGIGVEDIAVLHLVRDARGHVLSTTGGRDDDRPRADAMEADFSKWLAMNRDIGEVTRAFAVETIPVSYESLCFDTGRVLGDIIGRLGLSQAESLGNLAESRGHVGLGNPMRIDRVKSRKIVYDSRWFHDDELNALYQALPEVRDYNRRAAEASSVHVPREGLFRPKP